MKFLNFDINDVFNSKDAEKAKKYLNQKGYFADSLEDLDENLKLDNPRKGSLLVHVGVLTDLYDDKFGTYAFGTDSGVEFKYFLPYDSVSNRKFFNLFKPSHKEEHKVEYRPCENIKEVMNLVGVGSRKNDLIGVVVTLKNKTFGTIIRTMITEVLEFEDGTCDIVLGNTQFTLKDAFDIYEINIGDEYLPFGVKDVA